MRTLAIASFLATSLSAQVLVVDASGAGTHTDLAAAIAAAPAGAVIHLRGGVWGPQLVTRSLTILGENSPVIRAPLSGIGQQPPAIELQGTGVETFALGGVQLGGLADGFSWNYCGPDARR